MRIVAKEFLMQMSGESPGIVREGMLGGDVWGKCSECSGIIREGMFGSGECPGIVWKGMLGENVWENVRGLSGREC